MVTSHHANVLIVKLIDLLEVEHMGELTELVCEEEFSHGLRDEGGWEQFLLDLLLQNLLIGCQIVLS